MTLEWLTLCLVIVTAVLAVVTFYYAITTHRILDRMERQAQEMREQSWWLAKSAQISAWAALTTFPPVEDMSPARKLRALVKELEAHEERRADHSPSEED